MFHVAVDDDFRNVLPNAFKKPVAQTAFALHFFGLFEFHDAVGFTHADDLVRRQGAGAHAAFVAATVNLGFETHAGLTAHVKRTDSLGAVDLVTGKAHQIHLQLLHIKIHLPYGLRRVAVEDHALAAAEFADRGNVLNHADFVVDAHHGHQRRIRTNRGFEGLQVEKPVFLHVHIRHFKAFFFEVPHGIQNRLMFGFDRNKVLTLVLIKVRRPLHCQVVGFRRARRPHDLAGIGIDVGGDVGTRFFHRFFRFPTVSVRAARGIAELVAEVREHLHGHAGIHRGRGGVVKIHRQFERHFLTAGRLRWAMPAPFVS